VGVLAAEEVAELPRDFLRCDCLAHRAVFVCRI
jgi:hypothetical protein